MQKILIIDDERSIRNTLKEILEYENYEVDEAIDGEQGIEKALENSYDLVMCDIKMPKIDGLELLAKVHKEKPDMPIIMISGHGTIETAVECTKLGAFDFISKPPDLNRLLITIRNALQKGELLVETKVLKKKVVETRRMVGESPEMIAIKETIEKVSATEARILITGENGTGKELVALAIHEKSDRNKAPFVEVNCAAIPSELIESELFGHEKGAFTSAIKQKIGKFEQANGGTLFLDEIGDMDFSVQAKVLRALQENKITRVGGEKDIKVDVRVVSATNKNLEQEIENKRFRLDLYHRLNVINIHLPSLNQRGDDVKLIAVHIINEICKDYKISQKNLDSTALQALANYQWSGNVRELRNVIERLVILSGKATTITEQDVATYTNPLKLGLGSGTELYSQFNSLDAFKKYSEKQFIKYKLAQNANNIEKTAYQLEISVDALQLLLN